jgi:transcription elongation factor
MEYRNSTQNRMEELIRQRIHIQNKLRRAKEPEVIEELKNMKTALTEHIVPLRRDLFIAADIEKQTARMKEKLAIIKDIELQENLKQKGERVNVR